MLEVNINLLYVLVNMNMIHSMRHKHAKTYWNMLKQVCGVKTNTINLSTFGHYFESINSPSDPFFIPNEDILYFNERFA